MHSQCKFQHLIDSEQVFELVNILDNILTQIEAYANQFGLNTMIQGFSDEVITLKHQIAQYKVKVDKAVNEDEYRKFTTLFEEGLNLKQIIDQGYIFREYATFKANRDFMTNS